MAFLTKSLQLLGNGVEGVAGWRALSFACLVLYEAAQQHVSIPSGHLKVGLPNRQIEIACEQVQRRLFLLG